MPRLSRIRIADNGVEVLSPLERSVLNCLWKCKRTRVRDIYKCTCIRHKKVALTSVAVILDRLHKKKLVSRSIGYGRGGGYYMYSALADKEDFEQSVVESAVNKLIDSFGNVAVNYFNERFAAKKGDKK